MIKKYINAAFIYSIIAMVSGVFYREFTKILGFTGKTNLSVMHTHYFVLGMFLFLILALLEKNFEFSSQKGMKPTILMLHVGLNLTGIMFLVRGLTQVWGTELTNGMNAAISGMAGVGHIIIGGAIIHLFIQLRKKVS